MSALTPRPDLPEQFKEPLLDQLVKLRLAVQHAHDILEQGRPDRCENCLAALIALEVGPSFDPSRQVRRRKG